MAAGHESVFTGGAEGVIRRWGLKELLQGESPSFEEECHEEPIWSMAFNQRRQLLLTSSADECLTLLRSSGEGLEQVWQTRLEGNSPTVVEWLGDGRFASGLRGGDRIGVFDAERGRLGGEFTFEGRGGPSQANCLQLGPQKLVAAGHEDHFVRFYDPNSSKLPLTQTSASSKWPHTQMQ